MAMTSQDVAVGLVALVGVVVLVRKLTGAVRNSGTSSSVGCPTCGNDGASCEPSPEPKSR